MSDDNQIEIPPSFVALFVAPGRTRPQAPRSEIAARYGLCEDLATMLTETAHDRLWELGIAQTDVLARIHHGLLIDDSVVNTAEAQWVIRRLAELLDWDAPAFGTDAAAPP